MSTIPVSYSGSNGLNSLNGYPTQSTSNINGVAAQASTFSGSKSEIRAQIEELLKDIPKGDGGKLSFKDIDTYREKLETEWDESVKADLKKLGVDVDKKMPLSWDAAKGTLVVQKGHPNKAVIDNYFLSNQDKMDEFQRIIKLGKLTSTHQQKAEPAEMQRSFQQQAMSWWYTDNSDPTSWFRGGGRMLGATMATYKGLNLKV